MASGRGESRWALLVKGVLAVQRLAPSKLTVQLKVLRYHKSTALPLRLSNKRKCHQIQ